MVTAESGDTSKKSVDKNTVAEVDEEEFVEPPNSRASRSHTTSWFVFS